MSDYDLKKPCPGCPFRTEGGVRGLCEERLEEIVESDGGFTCHEHEEHECAGFLIFNLENRSAPQMMRIAGRLGMIDEDALMSHVDEVITDFESLVNIHAEWDR